MRYDYRDDFGLSGLAGQFRPDWSLGGSIHEVAATWASHDAEALLEDVVRLQQSSIPAWAVAAVWGAAAGPYSPEEGADWLDRLEAICLDRIRSSGGEFQVPETGPRSSELTGAVLDEIGLASQRLTDRLAGSRYGRGEGAALALDLLAREVCPDLAFRMLLRSLASFWVSIDQETFERYAALGHALGYGGDLVEYIDYLIGHDQ